MKKFFNFKNNVALSLSKLLKQGLSPFKLALVIALGITLSVFPILGTTTVICTLVALLFHLNLPAIQLANYAAFPLQVILFFPFYLHAAPSSRFHHRRGSGDHPHKNEHLPRPRDHPTDRGRI